MKKYLKILINRFFNSRVALPVTIVLIFFILSGLLVLFFEVSANDQFKNMIDAVWWSIITFSTTGYGDKVPITLGGRIVAVFSIFLGIGATSLLSGALASFLVDQNAKARKGLMEYKNIKNHFVICGWKGNMKSILQEILKLNPQMVAEDLIIISNIDPETIEELRKEKGLSGLRFVKGDYFSETPLQRANVKTAKKVIVLADKLESAAPSEVDSKTVMTVLTLRTMAKDMYICAELLDQKFEEYLKQARCDEIILSRAYSRMILANSSATNGISHIIYSLVSVEEDDTKLTTTAIPPKYIGKEYRVFKEEFDTPGKIEVIGILENTGSHNKMKLSALREAQKTSDMSTLVSNLKQVKHLEVNTPLLLPDPNYIIPPYSMAIVIEKNPSFSGGKK